MSDKRSFPLLDVAGAELNLRVEFETGSAPKFVRVYGLVYEAQFDDFCCLWAYQLISFTDAKPIE